MTCVQTSLQFGGDPSGLSLNALQAGTEAVQTIAYRSAECVVALQERTPPSAGVKLLAMGALPTQNPLGHGRGQNLVLRAINHD